MAGNEALQSAEEREADLVRFMKKEGRAGALLKEFEALTETEKNDFLLYIMDDASRALSEAYADIWMDRTEMVFFDDEEAELFRKHMGSSIMTRMIQSAARVGTPYADANLEIVPPINTMQDLRDYLDEYHEECRKDTTITAYDENHRLIFGGSFNWAKDDMAHVLAILMHDIKDRVESLIVVRNVRCEADEITGLKKKVFLRMLRKIAREAGADLTDVIVRHGDDMESML